MRRRGFSLVELLVVITIVAILAAIGIPVAMSAYTSAKGSAVAFRVAQLDSACETFKTRFGFYPTDFYTTHRNLIVSGSIQKPNPGQSDSALLQDLRNRFGFFLRKIAPNHREFVPHPEFNGKPPILHWYRTIGKNLNSTNALSFWLAGGFSESRSLPFSDRIQWPRETVAQYRIRAANVKIVSFFDFGTNLLQDPSRYNLLAEIDDAKNAIASLEYPVFLMTPTQKGTEKPLMFFSDVNGSRYVNLEQMPSKYIVKTVAFEVEGAEDSDSVNIVRISQPVFDHTSPTSSAPFFNTGKFQILAAGPDEVISEGQLGGSDNSDYGFTKQELRKAQRDDIANFSEGPIKNLDIAVERGL